MSSPLIPHSLRTLASACTLLLAFSLNAEKASAQLSSYAVSAVDVIGVTGASAVALGVPDYSFINDTGLSSECSNGRLGLDCCSDGRPLLRTVLETDGPCKDRDAFSLC